MNSSKMGSGVLQVLWIAARSRTLWNVKILKSDNFATVEEGSLARSAYAPREERKRDKHHWWKMLEPDTYNLGEL